MAVAPALLTSGTNTVGGASVATASVTPTSNRPVLIFAEVLGNPAGGTGLTASGCGLTWTNRASQFHNPDGTGANFQRLYAITGIAASPSAGVITLTPTADVDAALWFVIDLVGASTTPYVQSVTATGTSTTASATLASFASATNAALSFGLFYNSGETLSKDTNYTNFTAIDRAAFSSQAMAQYLASNSDLSPSFTITGTSVEWSTIALEIAEAGGGGSSAIAAIVHQLKQQGIA